MEIFGAEATPTKLYNNSLCLFFYNTLFVDLYQFVHFHGS